MRCWRSWMRHRRLAIYTLGAARRFATGLGRGLAVETLDRASGRFLPEKPPAAVQAALWAKFGVRGAGNETGRPVNRGGRRRRWSATLTLCQWQVGYSHGSVSTIHNQARLVSATELTADERWPTWQDSPSFRRKPPRGAFHAWTGRISPVGDFEAVQWPFAEISHYGTAVTSRRRRRRHRRLGRWAPSTSESPCRRLWCPARGFLQLLRRRRMSCRFASEASAVPPAW